MPIDNSGSDVGFLIENAFTRYDIFFFGGALRGDAEIRLFNEFNVQVGVIRFLNTSSLPNDVYENNIIFLHTNIITVDAIIHQLENSSQKIIHFDSNIPVATLKFAGTGLSV